MTVTKLEKGCWVNIKMYEIHWSIDAIEDVEIHQTYIEEDSPLAAFRWTEKIFAKEKLLEENAFLGRMIPEENKPTRRELIIDNFRLMYEVVSDSIIVILRVKRSKQDHT